MRFPHSSESRSQGPPLINNVVENILWPNSTDDNLIAPGFQPFESEVGEFLKRHAEIGARFFAH